MSSYEETWKPISAAVLALLTDLDPYGLEPGTEDGAPADEYSPEAVSIASHLINRGGISAADVDDIWRQWFGEPLSTIDSKLFSTFVAELNALVEPSPHSLSASSTWRSDHGGMHER
ncbi:hypothetical protein QL996_07365 [Planococcus sp. APC 4015]|nr:hypothetical protein [Planococcus sp. APC 4015]